jgi:SAM-dependent methyltransferase
MTRRVDFSGNAAVYDDRHGGAAEESGLRRICEAAALDAGSTILDIGAGTGRVSIPLCDLGYRVIAVEPAAGMLEKLRAKAGQRRIETLQAEGSGLPMESQSIDAVFIARLLYLTPDWRQILGEASRVLKSDGVLVHEWGNGTSEEPWVLVRQMARVLFQSEGIASPFHPGARLESEVDTYLASLGLLSNIRLVVGSGSKTSLREFLRRLVDGELSYIWDVPAEVREKCLPRLKQWAESTLDLDTLINMPKHIEWAVYKRRVAQQIVAAVGDT